MYGAASTSTPTPTLTPTPSAYKSREKRFKQLSDAQIRADAALLDVHTLSEAQQALLARVGTWRWTSRVDGSSRERPVLAFGALGEHHDGFFVIPDAVDVVTQLQIAHACLTEYVEPPHVTNMHQQNGELAGLWRAARASHPREPAKAPALSKLHWGAAGYHYDWTARKYYPANYSPVPEQLAALGRQCADACGETLEAEAVIVNFYKKSSTMGGHQDDVEYTMDHPVVSLSLGSRCVFLKGTETKEDAPLEVMLRSGDLAVLSGKSRLSFHGVAKVLPTEFKISEDEMAALVEYKLRHDKDGKETDNDVKRAAWRDELHAVQHYLGAHRININIRQVYADGAAPPPAEKEVHSANPQSREEEEPTAKRQKL